MQAEAADLLQPAAAPIATLQLGVETLQDGGSVAHGGLLKVQ
jgi:hypothetical protein